MNPSFVGQENSTCCCRFWCGNMREFKMLISQALGPDAPGDPLMRLERPFQFSICCCCVMICPQVYGSRNPYLLAPAHSPPCKIDEA